MPTDRQMDKEDMVQIPPYSMEYYSTIKRNKTGSFIETWMDLVTVIQSEVSQKKENKYHLLTYICGI